MHIAHKYILTDVDGVLLDWENKFHEWMADKGHAVHEDKHSYWLEDVYDIPPGKIMPLVREFNESSHIAFLEPFRDSVHYVKMLNQLWGYKFIAVTALSTDPDAIRLREYNLKTVFGTNIFAELHSIDTAACKRHILTQLKPKYSGCWWIEDRDDNADVGADLGYNSILMMHPHNMNYDGPAHRVQSWADIYSLITENH